MSLPLGTDEMLVAYLDNELSETQRKDLENQLTADDALAQRLALLERSNLPFKSAFEPLLEQAPDEHLQQQFSPDARKNHNVSRRNLIAAAVSFLALGVIGDRAFLHFSQPEENWRELVAQYMALYTPETLAETPTQQALDAQLKVTETQLGVTLAAANLALPNATLKNARVLAYEDRRIAQITWLESTGPLALCITRQTGEPMSTQSEQRLGMNIVYWANQSHQFMVIGHSSAAQMNEVAERLQRDIGA
ncbi:Predicted transmembrane transcriptional regulator (anti-sigma factor) [Buttiauxella agrestis]|uniref:Predicted transmembrane transcriptional regulator (Anti-sigma factor) n=1 Tax=Buttiauxella agrestis TaxID=82977 RepID=A0A381CAU9_9ENTR|nr:anti-sigma factor [Buttiauxella agrestis]SUW64960.1 Predicted transmembrane transcriptional regulator (anti-sigma factor) [Buttiauxella agrestis]